MSSGMTLGNFGSYSTGQQSSGSRACAAWPYLSLTTRSTSMTVLISLIPRCRYYYHSLQSMECKQDYMLDEKTIASDVPQSVSLRASSQLALQPTSCKSGAAQ